MNQFSNNKKCLASIKLLGDYWTLRIIDALQEGQLRFCELQRAVDNLNPVTLTSRLKKLEAAKLIDRHEDPADKISVTYTLTKTGLAALPVLEAVNEFSAKAKTTA